MHQALRDSYVPSALMFHRVTIHVCQLWEDLGSWRSALRKKAHAFVTQQYMWDPNNRRERNIEIAKNLLGNGGLFLRNGLDDEVC